MIIAAISRNNRTNTSCEINVSDKGIAFGNHAPRPMPLCASSCETPRTDVYVWTTAFVRYRYQATLRPNVVKVGRRVKKLISVSILILLVCLNRLS